MWSWLFWRTADTFVSYVCFFFFYEQQKIGIKASDVKVRSKTQFGRSISFFFFFSRTRPRRMIHPLDLHLIYTTNDVTFLPVLYAEIPGTSKVTLVRLTKFTLLCTNRSEISLDLAEIWRRIAFVKITGGEKNKKQTRRKQRTAQSVTAALTCTHIYCSRH